MPPSSASKSRKWCFTLNNPPGGAELYGDDWVVEYLIVGHEIAPSSGTPHHQGYVRFANPRALAGVRKLLPKAHWTPCTGTETQNYNYCTKEQVTVIEYGEREDLPPVEPDADQKGQGKRNDLRLARRLVKAGHGMAEICEQVDSYQALRAAELMLKFIEVQRDWTPEVVYIYGPTGTGKSHLAHSLAKTDPWISLHNGRWFEGYDAHEDVIFDDIRGDFCKFHVLLRLLDRWPYRIEVKGGSRQFLAKRIFITSCRPPHLLFPSVTGEDLMQLGRRISQIIYLERRGLAWSAPGTTIGVEPSVRLMIPELEPEQKSGVILAEPLRAPRVGVPPPTSPIVQVFDPLNKNHNPCYCPQAREDGDCHCCLDTALFELLDEDEPDG